MWRLEGNMYAKQPKHAGRAGAVAIAPLLTVLFGAVAQGLLDEVLAELRRASTDSPALVYGVAGLFGLSLLLGIVSLTSGLILRRSVRTAAVERPVLEPITSQPAPTPPAPTIAPEQPMEATIAEPLPGAQDDVFEDEEVIEGQTVAVSPEPPEAPPPPTQPIEATMAEVALDDSSPTPVSAETPSIGPPVYQPTIDDDEPTAWDDDAVETARVEADELEEADTEVLSAAEIAQIHLTGVDQPALRFTLSPSGGRLGSAPDCDCVIDAPTVSPYHAVIWRPEQTWLVRDLDSSEGTFINDERITDDYPFRDGDVLRVGSVRLLIEF